MEVLVKMKEALLIGAGSYVIGDSISDGVVLPSLMYLQKEHKIGKVNLVVRSKRSAEFRSSVHRYSKKMGYNFDWGEIVIESPESLEAVNLKEQIAFIVVPDAHHFEYLEYLLTNGVPTWCVKPLTGEGKLSHKLAKMSKDLNIPLWVDYHKRFDVSNQKIKKILFDNKYGLLKLYSVQYSQPQIIPTTDIVTWAKNVNVFQYIGCHYVDQIFYHFPNAKPVRVSATGIPGQLVKNNGPEFDIIHAIIDFKIEETHNLRTDFTVGWSDPNGASGKSHQRLDLQFENGRIIADQKVRGFQSWDHTKITESNPYFFEFLLDKNNEIICSGYGYESIEKFIGICDNQDWQNYRYPWASSTFQTDFVLDAVNESLKENGAWVSIKDVDSLG
jgi:predicted dehydrogenase